MVIDDGGDDGGDDGDDIFTKVIKAALPAPRKEGVRRKGEAINGDANIRTEKGLIWTKNEFKIKHWRKASSESRKI